MSIRLGPIFLHVSVTDIMTTCIPLCKHRAHKDICINREAIHLKNKKNKLWKYYTTTRSPFDHYEFCLARNHLCNLTRKLRYDFEKDLTSNIKTNPKSTTKSGNLRVTISWHTSVMNTGRIQQIAKIHKINQIFHNHHMVKASLVNQTIFPRGGAYR